MTRKNCVYCGKEITTLSSEHVIQNALGGLYESEDICCPECNTLVSQCIDAPFVKIFNPIVANIDNLTKSHGKNSVQSYTGTASYQGKEYPVHIKAGKVVSCPELSKELHCPASKIPMEIVSYNFNLDNDAYRTGMAKIAFNYALAAGVDFDLLKPGLAITQDGKNVSKIEYNYPIIPFYPVNPLDKYAELATPTELYHNMILFSQESQLWCYIDLFNTFQCYVLLADNLPRGTQIYDSYFQKIQKINRTVPDFDYLTPKDALIYAQQYKVEPTMDVQEMKRRIQSAIAKKRQSEPMEKTIEKKMGVAFYYTIPNIKTSQQIRQMNAAMGLYFDDEENLVKENFRTLTPSTDGTYIMTYPDAIMESVLTDQTKLKEYTTAKFNKLNAFLLNKSK